MSDYKVVAKRDDAGDGYVLSYGRGKKKLTVALPKTGNKFMLGDGIVSLLVPGDEDNEPIQNQERTLKDWKHIWGWWAKKVYEFSEEQRDASISHEGTVAEAPEEDQAPGPEENQSSREKLVEDWMFRLSQSVVDDICDAVLAKDIDHAVNLAVEHGGDKVNHKEARAFIRAIQEQFDDDLPVEDRRNYGEHDVLKSDPAELDKLTLHIKQAIKDFGFYDVMSCVSNACVMNGKDRDKKQGHGGEMWHNTANIVDTIVAECRKQ